MRSKVVALLIVLSIGSVMMFVLYSPAQLRTPAIRPVALMLPLPFEPAAVTGDPELPVVGSTAPLAVSAETPMAITAAVPPAAIQEPMAGDEQNELPALAAASLVAQTPLSASAGGTVPAAPSTRSPSQGAMRVAGRSIGTTFATTGRSIGTAFKRVF